MPAATRAGTHLGLAQQQMRFAGVRPWSVERKSVERRSAFEVTTLSAQTLHAFWHEPQATAPFMRGWGMAVGRWTV